MEAFYVINFVCIMFSGIEEVKVPILVFFIRLRRVSDIVGNVKCMCFVPKNSNLRNYCN